MHGLKREADIVTARERTKESIASVSQSTLHDLGQLIFLDRYALKDMTRASLQSGDTVIVMTEPGTGQREIGVVESIVDGEVEVRLANDEIVWRDLSHIDKPLETQPLQMLERVARGIAQVEKTPALKEEWREKFLWLLNGWKFVPGGRILTAAGSDQNLTYYNCYVIPSPRDSREGIMRTLSQMTEIMSRGGGVGINLSSLRPSQAYVRGVNGRSSGSVSWGGLYSFVTGLIEQGGSRRGALMLILNDWHPDVFEFINSKRISGRITNANISVAVSDELMKAVQEDGEWPLLFPDTDHPQFDETWDGDLTKWREAGNPVIVKRTVKARELWNAIISSAWASAEPGVWFNERSNKMANSWYFNPLISTNPCGEQPLGAFSVCNLGAINLARFYDEANDDVAWQELRQTVRYATRFLDNVIDATPYFFEENRQIQTRERRLGLGTMGVAELMIRKGIRYGSEESVAFLDRLFEFIAVESYEASCDLAVEKGAFPELSAELYLQSGFMRQMPASIQERVRQDGIRNVTILTQAPTGTTGTMVNTSTGIEPFFSWQYFRKSRLGMHEEQVPLVKEYFERNPEAEQLPDYFVTAMDLSPEEHIRVQAAIQRWVDAAISKTCNVPSDYSVEQVSELYQLMYQLGCKGGTIYRDGSRDEQVLMLQEEDEGLDVEQVSTPHRVYPRPEQLQGTTISRKTPFGTAYLTLNKDENENPFEVFVTIGKAGSDLQADAEGLGRLLSLMLRTTAPANRRQMVKLIIDELEGIGGQRSVGLGHERVTSLPDAIAGVLRDTYLSEEDVEQLSLSDANPAAAYPTNTVAMEPDGNQHMLNGADLCPECGSAALIRQAGCRNCVNCGFSEC